MSNLAATGGVRDRAASGGWRSAISEARGVRFQIEVALTDGGRRVTFTESSRPTASPTIW
jgi:hypothetical protein